MSEVKIFQVNEYDGVAAQSEEQAKAYYLQFTGVSEEEAFYDFQLTEVPLQTEIWENEDMTSKVRLCDLLKKEWNGHPFLVYSSAI